MKKSAILLPLILLMTLVAGSLFAQSSDRFDRDIRIAEGIIEELFGAENSPQSYLGRNTRNVSGQYIPGYGIHFSIAANYAPAIIEMRREGQVRISVNGSDDSDSDDSRGLSRDIVEERFMEYLMNYAPLFDDLPGDEVIRLTFGGQSDAPNIFMLRSTINNENRDFTNLTAWVTASDIRAFDENSISESEFENRVEIIDLEDQEEERDQTVFASILQTSLSEISDTIRVRRSPKAEYLPGLGLSYTINANVRSGWFDFGDVKIEGLRIETDSLSVEISNMLEGIDMSGIQDLAQRIDSITGLKSPDIDTEELERSAREAGERIREQQRESLSDEDVNKLVDRFHGVLIQTVQDYGPTLRSLENDEMLLITINWTGRHTALPARSELRIQKSEILNGEEPVIEEIQRR
ncbi:MAG TPA: hypothetical protein VJ915_09205 [Balneolaceae bacterium]|nr:hypothetical protein [Balneolaceae bacterium]